MPMLFRMCIGWLYYGFTLKIKIMSCCGGKSTTVKTTTTKITKVSSGGTKGLKLKNITIGKKR